MAFGDLWVSGLQPPMQVYQRNADDDGWETGIAGPSGQTALSGIAFHPTSGRMWVCGSTPDEVYQRNAADNGWETGIAAPSGVTALTGITFHPTSGRMWVCASTPDEVYQRNAADNGWETGIAAPSGQTIRHRDNIPPHVRSNVGLRGQPR